MTNTSTTAALSRTLSVTIGQPIGRRRQSAPSGADEGGQPVQEGHRRDGQQKPPRPALARAEHAEDVPQRDGGDGQHAQADRARAGVGALLRQENDGEDGQHDGGDASEAAEQRDGAGHRRAGGLGLEAPRLEQGDGQRQHRRDVAGEVGDLQSDQRGGHLRAGGQGVQREEVGQVRQDPGEEAAAGGVAVQDVAEVRHVRPGEQDRDADQQRENLPEPCARRQRDARHQQDRQQRQEQRREQRRRQPVGREGLRQRRQVPFEPDEARRADGGCEVDGRRDDRRRGEGPAERVVAQAGRRQRQQQGRDAEQDDRPVDRRGRRRDDLVPHRQQEDEAVDVVRQDHRQRQPDELAEDERRAVHGLGHDGQDGLVVDLPADAGRRAERRRQQPHRQQRRQPGVLEHGLVGLFVVPAHPHRPGRQRQAQDQDGHGQHDHHGVDRLAERLEKRVLRNGPELCHGRDCSDRTPRDQETRFGGTGRMSNVQQGMPNAEVRGVPSRRTDCVPSLGRGGAR